MKCLEDLPYRFWPRSALPEGVPEPEKLFNVKSADFKRSYVKRVNPVLKAAGFKCSGTTARRFDDKLSRMVWYGTGKAGGSGVVAIAALIPGLPTPGETAQTADKFEIYGACFKKSLELVPGLEWFDLGRDAEQSLETANLMAEAFESQGHEFFARLDTAEEVLLAVDPDDWVEPMTHHYQTFGLSLLGFSVRPGTLPHAATAQFLARLHARAGRAERARRFAEIGLQAIAEELAPHHRHAYHTWKLRFEKLLAGDRTFLLDAADCAEVDRRVEVEKLAGA